MEKEEISKGIARALLKSKKTAVLTGAGISTESGIPDFRSPGGIWSKFDAGVMTRDLLYGDPEEFFRQGMAMLSFLEDIENTKPHVGHLVLAEMEREGLLACIITQNIDGLHLKAGSKKVYEVHGNIREGYCTSCRKKVEFSLLTRKIKEGENPPMCSKCGGMLRPGVVLFGDGLPDCYREALVEVKNSDMLLVIGSSLGVAPVNNLPALSKKYIIINKEKTHYDRSASIVWHERAGPALEKIQQLIHGQ